MHRTGTPPARTDAPVVLLTGASVGLGLAVAQRLVADGRERLVLTARRASLPRFADAGITESPFVRLRALDVTSDGDRLPLLAEVERDWGGVDVLINNAGVSYRSVVEHVTDGERLAQMDVNFRSPMELARLILPSMRRKRAGRIITVSSVGGMMAMPTMAVYSASKFALEGGCEALWYEVRPWGIKVSLIEPGFIHSESFQNVRHTSLSAASVADDHEAYHAHYEHMAPFIARMMRWSRATPDSVARVIVRTMRRSSPPLRVLATGDAWVFAMLRRWLPRRLYHWLLYRSLPRVDTWGPHQPSDEPGGS